MRMKSYFAATVEGALNLARQELGPEAMLVNSRRTGLESRHLGDYEVVCAVVPDQLPRSAIETAAAFQSAAEPAVRTPTALPRIDKLSQEVAGLKRHMERLASTIARSTAGYSSLTANPALAEAFALLTSSDVDPNLALDIVSRIGHDLNSSPAELLPPGVPPATLHSEIQRLLAVEPRLGQAGANRTVVALVGPPGCGKTTSLVKLAARYALSNRKPSQILSLDTFRVGAADQLRSYAAILGVGFQVVETTLALAQALEEHNHKDMILIDTPGFGRHDIQDGADIARFLATRADVDVHLLIPASMKAPDMTRMIDQYESFRPNKLLFTRADETETFGPILNQIVRTGKPVSYLSSGQQIPEDIQAATKEYLTDLILQIPAGTKDLAASVAAA